MRNPFRSEAGAFSFVLMCVGLFAVVAVAGVLFGGWVALAVFLVLAVGLAFYIKGAPKEAGHVAPAAAAATLHPPSWRTRPSPAALRGRSSAGPRATPTCSSICPALNSPLRHWASDGDGARALTRPPGGIAGADLRPASRQEARSATPTPSRRWTMRYGRSAQTRSSSRRTRRGVRTGREGDHRARAGATTCPSRTSSSTSKPSARPTSPTSRRWSSPPSWCRCRRSGRTLRGLAGDARNVGRHVDRVLARDDVRGHRRRGESICPRTAG